MALRKIWTAPASVFGVSAVVYRDTEWTEYRARLVVDSVERPESADYHTDDKKDAIATARALCDAENARIIAQRDEENAARAAAIRAAMASRGALEHAAQTRAALSLLPIQHRRPAGAYFGTKAVPRDYGVCPHGVAYWFIAHKPDGWQCVVYDEAGDIQEIFESLDIWVLREWLTYSDFKHLVRSVNRYARF